MPKDLERPRTAGRKGLSDMVLAQLAGQGYVRPEVVLPIWGTWPSGISADNTAAARGPLQIMHEITLRAYVRRIIEAAGWEVLRGGWPTATIKFVVVGKSPYTMDYFLEDIGRAASNYAEAIASSTGTYTATWVRTDDRTVTVTVVKN